MMEQMTIGKLAAAADVNVETIRYYQRQGLLSQPDKPQGGFRAYSGEDAKRLRFIKRAQALGFTLTDIGKLLSLNESHTLICAETRELASRKLALIAKKIADLNAIHESLLALVCQCDSVESLDKDKCQKRNFDCPIINVLSKDEES